MLLALRLVGLVLLFQFAATEASKIIAEDGEGGSATRRHFRTLKDFAEDFGIKYRDFHSSALGDQGSVLTMALTLGLVVLAWVFFFVVVGSFPAIVTSNVEAFRSMIRRVTRTDREARVSSFPFGFLKRSSDLAAEERSHKKRKGRHSNENDLSTSSSSASSNGARTSQYSDFWDDLLYPFASEGIEDYDSANDNSTGSLLWEEPEHHTSTAPAVTHFCFLVHGHRGFSRDLRYMQLAMQRFSTLERKRLWEQEAGSMGNVSTAPNADSSVPHDIGLTPDDSERSSSVPKPKSKPSTTSDNGKDRIRYRRQDIVIHSAVCNERKTVDGIQSGGNRLAEEMRETILRSMSKWSSSDNGEIRNITISFVGNSLGGLYSRYALSKFTQDCTEDGEAWIFDGTHLGVSQKYRVHLNIFCTTATPHLGISQHTYVPLPRTAEIGVAHAMGDTGKDLFRVNNLIKTMSTSPVFLRPLARFRKRIAYANAYGTDFPVPAGTAAFLSPDSAYPHHFESPDPEETGTRILAPPEISVNESRSESDSEGDGEDTRENDGRSSLIIAVVHTPKHEVSLADLRTANPRMTVEECVANSCKADSSSLLTDELHDMSTSLDRLGWKKVFVDMRNEIPSVEIPRSLLIRRSESDLAVDANISALKRKGVVQSKDIAMAVSSPEDNRVSIPLGHNMIVAFSRSRISTLMNKGGRPVVDALAKELVQDIFSFDTDAQQN